MYVEVKLLPPVLQNVLKDVGYGKVDIQMNATETININDNGSAGRRAFVVLIDLDGGASPVTLRGSWGGPNIANPTNPVDMDGTEYPIPENGAVIKGSEGGSVWAAIYLHPNRLQKLLPTAGLPDVEQAILYVYKAYKSASRADEIRRQMELFQVEIKHLPGILDRLVDGGFLKKDGRGIQITTKGKNAITKKFY